MCVSVGFWLAFQSGLALLFGGLQDSLALTGPNELNEFKLFALYVAGKDKRNKGRKREAGQH